MPSAESTKMLMRRAPTCAYALPAPLLARAWQRQILNVTTKQWDCCACVFIYVMARGAAVVLV